MKLVILSMALSFSLFAQNGAQLINWFAGADIVGTTGSSDANIDSDMYVREFEFSAYSSIDQTWDGVLTLAYHKESVEGEEHLEVHEAFLFSSKLLNLSNIKIGKVFMGFGRINRFHRHDWVFTDAPLVQKSFFGNEGAKDTGVEIKRNLPDLESTITFGVMKGDEFNHTHIHEHEGEEEVERALAPTVYARYAKFFELTTTKGFELGLNAIHRLDAHGIDYLYSGVDFIFKNRTGKFLETLVQSEIWTRNQTHKEDGETERINDIGGYLYLEKGLDQHHSYGIRLDYYRPDDHEEEAGSEHEHGIDGLEVDKEYKALALSYIYTNSEFMKTRFTVEHGQGIIVDDNADVDSLTKAQLQFVFSIGAHPAHVY